MRLHFFSARSGGCNRGVQGTFLGAIGFGSVNGYNPRLCKYRNSFKPLCDRVLDRYLNLRSGTLEPMPTIRLKENEPFEVAMRRFKRTIEKTGLLTDLRAREFYEKPTTERKRKLAAAVKRHYKRLRSQMLPKKLY